MASVQTRRQLREEVLEASVRSKKLSVNSDLSLVSGGKFTIDTSQPAIYIRKCKHPASLAASRSAIDIRKYNSVSESGDNISQTPVKFTVSNTVEDIKKQLVAHGSASCETSEVAEAQKSVTPVLARLKYGSSGNNLEDVRASLLLKHQDAKDRVDSLCVGGGISIWPNMQDMRLSNCEVVMLISASLILCYATWFLFSILHGQLLNDLHNHWLAVSEIAHLYPLVMDRDNSSFVNSVLEWHRHHKLLVDDIHKSFDVSLYNAPSSYTIGVVVYAVSIAFLLYFLADNVLAKSRLTPRRIKHWVLLLTVSATWTVFGVRLFVAAQQLETVVKKNVYTFNEHLGDLLYSRYDLSVYRDVMSYWRTRCLLVTSPPLLSIIGLVAVNDIYYYLQYYSLPVLSALLLPVVRLAWALFEVYKPQSPPK